MRRTLLAVVVLVLFAFPAAAQEELTLRGHTGWVGTVAFSPSGNILATGSSDRTIRLWDVATRQPLGTLKGHSDTVSALAFTKPGTLASGSWDKTVILWDMGQRSVLSKVERRPAEMILSLANSPDGLLACGSMDGSISLIRPPTVHHMKPHRSWVNGLAFAGNGLLASASSDHTLQLWQQKKDWMRLRTLEVNEGEIRSVTFSPDSKLVAAGIRYGTIKVWEVDSGRLVTNFKGHVSDVWSLAFAPDGRTLASGNGDWDKPGDIKFWDTTSWKETRTLRTSGEVLCLAFSPNGRYLAAGSWDRMVRLWNLRRR